MELPDLGDVPVAGGMTRHRWRVVQNFKCAPNWMPRTQHSFRLPCFVRRLYRPQRHAPHRRTCLNVRAQRNGKWREHAGARRRYPFALQPREWHRTAGALTRWRPLDRPKSVAVGAAAQPRGLDERFASIPVRPRRAAHRRTRRNARAQRNGKWRCARRVRKGAIVRTFPSRTGSGGGHRDALASTRPTVARAPNPATQSSLPGRVSCHIMRRSATKRTARCKRCRMARDGHPIC